jgi:hypothetical protein
MEQLLAVEAVDQVTMAEVAMVPMAEYGFGH